MRAYHVMAPSDRCLIASKSNASQILDIVKPDSSNLDMQNSLYTIAGALSMELVHE